MTFDVIREDRSVADRIRTHLLQKRDDAARSDRWLDSAQLEFGASLCDRRPRQEDVTRIARSGSARSAEEQRAFRAPATRAKKVCANSYPYKLLAVNGAEKATHADLKFRTLAAVREYVKTKLRFAGRPRIGKGSFVWHVGVDFPGGVRESDTPLVYYSKVKNQRPIKRTGAVKAREWHDDLISVIKKRLRATVWALICWHGEAPNTKAARQWYAAPSTATSCPAICSRLQARIALCRGVGDLDQAINEARDSVKQLRKEVYNVRFKVVSGWIRSLNRTVAGGTESRGLRLVSLASNPKAREEPLLKFVPLNYILIQAELEK